MGTVLLAITPAWVLMYCTDLPWTGFVLGLLALGAAWFGGERFILRQVRVLLRAAARLGAGDLSSRTGLSGDRGELGQLAAAFDSMAAALEQRGKEQEQAEKTLLNRSFQQTVVSALGQFALMGKDLPALFNQAVMLVAQTVEVEYCDILELLPDGQSLQMRAGVGWKEGAMETLRVPAGPATQAGFTLAAGGEPVVIEHLPGETRFWASPFLVEHGAISGISVAISGHGRAFGILGAHTANRRTFTDDEVHFLLAVATVIAIAVERTRAEAELQKLASFAQLNPNPAMELSAAGAITYFNDAALKLANSLGRDHPSGILPPDNAETVWNLIEKDHNARRFETRLEGHTLSWSFHPVAASQVVHCYVEDITSRLSLEAQLLQSQKMESIGQLAAGVAHDFNNMLTVIQGHSGLLMVRPTLPPELLEPVQAIYFAAERAANLTRQLLMFSRKNVMQSKPLDLREVVANMSKMLNRLLGETIALEFHSPSGIPLVEGDAGMIEQVIMNLAVNARDAMPGGGTLAITMSSVEMAEACVQTHPAARVGSFVCLRVADTGCGMEPAVMNRIFEPFFTTKEVGRGTGLGLATVYGIVKQHEGWVEVTSEVGKGSTFNVFFPASSKPAEAVLPGKGPAAEVRGGKETILVVEDEPVLRDMARVILESCGYHVLEAASGREALEVWKNHRGAIDLLLADMIMPEGISGMDLARQLLAFRPGLKIVFASGYSMDELDTDFFRKGHARFLQKPYTHVTLTETVRDYLDEVI